MENQKEDQFAIVKSKAEEMDAMLEKFTVENDEQLAIVADKIKSVKTLKKMIEKEKDKFVAPAKEIIAEAKGKYDPFIKKCENAEEVLKQRAGKYMGDKERARQEEEARIAKKVESGYIKPETAMKKMEALPESQKTVRTDQGSGLRMSKRKVAVITEPEKIPDEYWVINEVRVRREALDKDKSGAPQIPGVEIREESSIASI